MDSNASFNDARSKASLISIKRIADRSTMVTVQPSVASTKASPANPAVASRMPGVLPDFKPTALAIA